MQALAFALIMVCSVHSAGHPAARMNLVEALREA